MEVGSTGSVPETNRRSLAQARTSDAYVYAIKNGSSGGYLKWKLGGGSTVVTNVWAQPVLFVGKTYTYVIVAGNPSLSPNESGLIVSWQWISPSSWRSGIACSTVSSAGLLGWNPVYRLSR